MIIHTERFIVKAHNWYGNISQQSSNFEEAETIAKKFVSKDYGYFSAKIIDLSDGKELKSYFSENVTA